MTRLALAVFLAGGLGAQQLPQPTRAPIYIFDYDNGRLSAQRAGTLEETIDTSELYWSGLVHHRTKPLLFAANRGTGAGPSNVVVFDTSTGQLLQRIPVEINPYALVLSDDGRTLYASNGRDGEEHTAILRRAPLRQDGLQRRGRGAHGGVERDPLAKHQGTGFAGPRSGSPGPFRKPVGAASSVIY